MRVHPGVRKAARDNARNFPAAVHAAGKDVTPTVIWGTGIRVGEECMVYDYWTGPFRARVLQIWNTQVRLAVTDTMRPRPPLPCDFPRCELALEHDGDHEPAFIYVGLELEIPTGRHARFGATEEAIRKEIAERQETA